MTQAPVLVSERILVRFSATLATNVLRGALTFATGLVVARGLGATAFGDFNFLMGSFVAVSQLLEAGTSSAFFTFLSQRRRSIHFLSLYAAWMLAQFAGTVAIVGLVLPPAVSNRIWLGQPRDLVLAALTASFLMNQGWVMVSQMGEARRRTALVQGAWGVQAIAHLALVAVALHQHWLTVRSLCWLTAAEFGLLILLLGPRLARGNLAVGDERYEKLGSIFADFRSYCTPLVLYGWVGFVYTFADRWLLQHFGGAVQQAYFSVGQQFANVSLIATVSILRVFWKEVAEALERGDTERARELYAAVSRGLYFTGAWITGVLLPFSREILLMTVGRAYESGWLCLALMFLYPIHQALGQIQGTFFYASADTRTYTAIALVTMIVSIPVTYLLLASSAGAIPGLGLGAIGLAAKMVVLQIGGVSAQAAVIAKRHRWTTDFSHQALVLVLVLTTGYISRWISHLALRAAGIAASPIVWLAVSAVIYIALTAPVLFRNPTLAGVSRSQLAHATTDLVRHLRRSPFAASRA